MTTIVTRSGKGTQLTHNELDANFTNLNNAKLEAGTQASNIANTPSGNLSSINLQDAVNELDGDKVGLDALSANTGASLVGFFQSGTGAVSRTAQDKLREIVSVKDFGAVGDGVTNDTAAIQAAIDYVATRVTSYLGGEVEMPSGIYLAAGLVLKNRVKLRGAGRGATIIKAPDGANTDVMTIPTSAALIGWSGLTIDGNKSTQTYGSGIVFETGGSSDGNSGAPYTNKSDTPPESYKHCVAYDFVVGNCKENGVVTTASNYQIFFDDFAVSHNDNDGLSVFSSDGIYSNFYCEKNGRAGLYVSGSSNKFSAVKVIWNGRIDNSYGGLREQGSRNLFIGVESQDNYTHGVMILGISPTFIGCQSNTNGYLSVGNEDKSSGVHADILVGASASGITFIGHAYTYKTAVGTDGKWTTQWPYYFNAYSAAQVVQWRVDFDKTKYNAVPNVITDMLFNDLLGSSFLQSTDGSITTADFNPQSGNGAGNITVRLFRTTNTSGNVIWQLLSPNTASVMHQFNAKTGDVALSAQGTGDTIIGNSTTGGAWNTSKMRLGPYRFWVDSSGRLRIKNGAPASDTDGTIVGTQS